MTSWTLDIKYNKLGEDKLYPIQKYPKAEKVSPSARSLRHPFAALLRTCSIGLRLRPKCLANEHLRGVKYPS
jgi:hypothetical protein